MDIPLLPVRCLSCNKVIGHLGRKLIEYTRRGYTVGDALTSIGVIRVCCRQSITHTVDDTMWRMIYHNPQRGQEKRTVYLTRQPQ